MPGFLDRILRALRGPAPLPTVPERPPEMTLEIAFATWIQFLSGNGFAPETYLNPPATEAAITQAETDIGFALPSDARALYLLHDGQKDIYRNPDPAPGTISANIFGYYEFLPLSGLVQEYKNWEDIYISAGDHFDDDFNSTVLRGDDPVVAAYWRPGWIPFASDGSGNFYAFDMIPTEGGTIGQIIVIGADEDLRRVLAPDLSSFLDSAATTITTLPPADDKQRVIFSME